MITPAYVQTMARYNRWQNQSIYAAAATLSDAQRKEPRGAFFGMTHETTRADLGRAVLEGVAFAFADGQDALREAGTRIDDVAVTGDADVLVAWWASVQPRWS